MSRTFPDRFLWGAATAAYQVEGSPLADGAGASIWHRFTHDPRLMIASGDTGDVACDHYNRMEDDVELMKQLGLQAYRFSISWSRILPEGTGRVNQVGLDFYRRLVDRLNDAGIVPRPSLAAERTAQILDAFARCIGTHGLEGTSLQRIADEAGVQRFCIWVGV